ncbi:hypothetical protein ACIP93_24955 [Streptomyces sp. NPDC088745]|uniref:hypothetical protein n=1 Tax=Streptomyces sp. NPDC088745 TaxID=3365884 RepID=UPI0038308AE2
MAPSTQRAAGMQEIQACAPDGYDFARLVWQGCEVGRPGLILKIRITGPWQRHGYGSRMVRFALHGRDEYRWTTPPQSQDAQAFFPALTETNGVAFPRAAELCEHMRRREHPFIVCNYGPAGNLIGRYRDDIGQPVGG